MTVSDDDGGDDDDDDDHHHGGDHMRKNGVGDIVKAVFRGL